MAPLYTISILARIWFNEEVFELTCSRPPGFQFLAGQNVALVLEEEERDYSLISSPDAPELRFLIKQVAGGRVTTALANLAPGSVLGMSQARGYLTFRPTPRPVFFIATGVGIAPFVAMAADGVRGFTLIHGARTGTGFFYHQELTAAATQYIPCLSGKNDTAPAGVPALYHGYVTAYVKAHLQPGEYDFYLCGSLAMIRDMTHFLDQYHPTSRIYSEAFS